MDGPASPPSIANETMNCLIRICASRLSKHRHERRLLLDNISGCGSFYIANLVRPYHPFLICGLYGTVRATGRNSYALAGKRQPISHRQHGKIDTRVLCKLFVERADRLRVRIARLGIYDPARPEHIVYGNKAARPQ